MENKAIAKAIKAVEQLEGDALESFMDWIYSKTTVGGMLVDNS